MFHRIILKIMHLGWLALPFPLYALYSRHFLDQKQAQLLIIQALILLSFMLPGWLVLVIKLIATGFFVLIVLDLCITQYEQFINRYEQQRLDTNPNNRKPIQYRYINNKPIFMINKYRLIKKFKFKQTFIWPFFVLIWILIKIRFTKATQFGKGILLSDGTIFNGFIDTFDGWNCNYTQLTFIPLLWFIVLIFCWWFMIKMLQCGRLDPQITKQYYNDVNGYKMYLLNYLIIPAIILMIFDVGYNLYAHVMCDGLLECYQYFKFGIVFILIGNWGVPVSIGVFFYKKIGRFLLQSQHDNSQVSMDQADVRQQQNLLSNLNN